MSNKSDRVLGTPPTNTSGLPSGLIQQQRKRARALKRIAKLKIKAAAEIDRLLAFLDACDPYVTAELEDDGEQDDASYPEGGPQGGLGRSHEDDEPDTDDEPSLGSSGHGDAGPVSYFARVISDGYEMIYDCEGDEHDGREPTEDDEPSLAGKADDAGAHGDDQDLEGEREDDEPSLGWTIDGEISRTTERACDLEATSGEAML